MKKLFILLCLIILFLCVKYIWKEIYPLLTFKIELIIAITTILILLLIAIYQKYQPIKEILKNNNEKAIEILLRQLNNLPTYNKFARSYICSNLSVAYVKLENYDKALEYINQAIEYNPKVAIFYTNKAFIYIKTKQYDEAEKLLEIVHDKLDSEKFLKKLFFTKISKTVLYSCYIKLEIEKGNSKKAEEYLNILKLFNPRYKYLKALEEKIYQFKNDGTLELNDKIILTILGF